MGRKLRSMFKSVTPRPGSGERPISPLTESSMLGGVPVGSVMEPAGASSRGGTDEAKGELPQDAVARLAYERWLETGGSAVENWMWAEAELKRRGG